MVLTILYHNFNFVSYRFSYCCVQMEEGVWWCWCFDDNSVDNETNDWQWMELPRFKRVRVLRTQIVGGRKFLTCSCGFRNRVGVPCRHQFCVTDGDLDLGMVDVRWLRVFHNNFGDDSNLGKMSKL